MQLFALASLTPMLSVRILSFISPQDLLLCHSHPSFVFYLKRFVQISGNPHIYFVSGAARTF